MDRTLTRNSLESRAGKIFTTLLIFGLVACIIPVNSSAFAFTSGQSASIVLGQPDFASNSAATSQSGLHIESLGYNGPIFDSSGNLWVTDENNHRVLEFPKGAGFTSGESASLVLGQSSFTAGSANKGGSTAADSLDSPAGITFDSSGNLWVADESNNRVLEYTTPFTSGESASLVLGQGSSFTSNTANNGGISASSLSLPQGITFDSSGNLWIGDSLNHRVLEFPKGAGFTSGESASLVLGQGSSFTSNTANNGGISASSLFFPQGITFDSSGNLWTSDSNNNRMLEYLVLAISPPTVPEFPFGGVALLLAISVMAYAAIRYKIIGPSNLRISRSS